MKQIAQYQDGCLELQDVPTPTAPLAVACFWQIQPREDADPGGPRLAGELEALLQNSVRLRMIADRPLAAMVDELLSESSQRKRGFYDPATVRGLIDSDRRGVEDHGMVIWTLLTTELWFRTFFDELAS